MLRLQMPERSSFRFGRKSYISDDKENSNAPDQVNTKFKIQPHIPLPLVHHTSTKSLFDLFQPQDESAYGFETKKNEEQTTSSPFSAQSMQENMQKPVLENGSVSRFDALGSHGDQIRTSSVPTTTLVIVPLGVSEHEHSSSSTPSSGFRDDDGASGCSRKSSTSSVGTPLAGHKAYFKAVAAQDKEGEGRKIPQPDTRHSNSPKAPEETLIRSIPQYDKPLPEPPSPERPFSVGSVLSIMRADSLSKTARQSSMQIVADAPVIFRREPQMRTSHGRSASEDMLHSKKSTTFKVKSPTTSPTSKRGTRLVSAISQGLPHGRSRTLSDIAFLPPGSALLEKPRPLSFNLPVPFQPNGEAIPLDRFAEETPISISPSVAEKLVFEIMRRLDEPADLLSAAAVNRGFRGTFKRAEPRLVHELLRRQCPAAWEFQKNKAQASGEPLSLQEYMNDKATVTFIKSALLASCDLTLQPETMAGLVGADMTRNFRIDAALWRIWTFCKGFGHRSLSGDDLTIQVDWLNGGRIARKRHIKTAVGRGNGRGVSTTDLEDMLELWDSLGGMLASFSNNFTEARAAGIFNKCTIDGYHTEEWFLEEWTYYVRSLGLPAVLSISSATSFEQARESGLTDWTPPVHGQTRAGFFRTAVTSAYQERILAEAATKATQFPIPPRSQHRPAASDASISSLEQLTRALERHAAQPPPLKINTSLSQVRRKPLSHSLIVESSKPNTTWQPETPDTPYPSKIPENKQPESEYPEREHDVRRNSLRDSWTPPIRNSIVLQSLSVTSTASTRLGATLFPMEYPPTSPKTTVLSPFSRASFHHLPAPTHNDVPAVIDPADKAMRLLTQDMGFSAADASRALAKCDTGFGIDVQKAIDMLENESGRKLSASLECPPKTPLPTSPVKASAPTSPGKARALMDSCIGYNEHIATEDSAAAVEVKPFEPLCDTYPVRQPSVLGNLNRNSLKGLTRMTSKAKAYKALGMGKFDKTSGVTSVEENHPPRAASMRAIHGGTKRPLQPLPADQRSKSKTPPRKPKDPNVGTLMGIDEEPSVKAMKVLGVDEVEIRDGRISPATSTVAKRKPKSTKRFYEGRFGSLAWSDVGIAK